MTICPPKVPFVLAWNRNRSSTDSDWRRSAWTNIHLKIEINITSIKIQLPLSVKVMCIYKNETINIVYVNYRSFF